MSPKKFTLEEANALLPTLIPLVEQLQTERAKTTTRLQRHGQHFRDLKSDFGGPLASSLANAFWQIEQLTAEIDALGCVLKDPNVGIVDFLTVLEDGEVYLCWKLGETAVSHYHELHEGFMQRKAMK